ncbi:MAG: GNAT family N-acetyltransferase [Oscillospiraceae bacterium]|nr:GNAT family N-acetyltransferase [Oscillospiraceae bacterium]
MTHYEIFKACFPQLKLTEKQFEYLVKYSSCTVFEHCENGSAAGFVLVYRSNVRLLCVHPEYQGRGIGTALMKQAEEHIAGNGYMSITAGGLDSGLFIGEVISKEQFDAQGSGFLSRCGFAAKNGCVEMNLDLNELSAEKPVCPDGVQFRLYDGEKAELLEAAEKIDPDWVQYFEYAENVFAAYYNGALAGACILGFDDTCLVSGDGFKTGNIGCVGVVPEMRRQGIGLSMVAKAAELLKESGCKNAFIHYTHLDKWYGKIGAKPVVYCAFSNKKLK